MARRSSADRLQPGGNGAQAVRRSCFAGETGNVDVDMNSRPAVLGL
jgi:hypothetical protein